MLSLFFGPRSKNHEYTTKYNGRSFKIRLKQFFRCKTYKVNQIFKLGNHEIKLTKFIRYNNCFDEYWEYEYVEFKNLKKNYKWFKNERISPT